MPVAERVQTQRYASFGDHRFSQTSEFPIGSLRRETEFSHMAPEMKAQRVLIYRIGSLGDTIVALPCFHLIARKYPDAERILLTNFPVHAKAPASAAVLANSGLVHGYMQYTIGTRSPLQLLRLAAKIRQFRPDVLIYLMPPRAIDAVRRDSWFFKFGGAVKHIVGQPTEFPARRQEQAPGLY